MALAGALACQRDSYLKEVGCVCVSLSKRQLSKAGRVCLCVTVGFAKIPHLPEFPILLDLFHIKINDDSCGFLI